MARYRYWRVSNIVYRNILPPDKDDGSTSTVLFSNTDYIDSTPSNGTPISESYPYDFNNGKAISAFDKDSASYAISEYASRGKGRVGWWIGFEFKKAVVCNAVILGQSPKQGHTWKSADVDVSEDGVVWRKYGEIHPNMEDGDYRLKSCIIVNILDVVPPSKFKPVDMKEVAYKYWRFEKPKYYNTPSTGVALKTFRIHIEREREALDPSKLTLFNEGANKDTLLKESPSAVYTSQTNLPEDRWYLQYEFEEKEKVLGLTIEYSTDSPRLSELTVLGSNDAIYWDLVSVTSIPNNPKVEVSLEREGSFKRIGSFPYNPDLKWYQTISTANCIFAIDANSKLEDSGKRIFRQDDKSKFIQVAGISPNKNGVEVQESIVNRFLTKNQETFNPKDMALAKYLKFASHIFDINPPVTDVRDLTVLYRIKRNRLNDASIFYTTTVRDTGTLDFSPGVNAPIQRRPDVYSDLKDGLDLCALTYDSLTGEATLYSGNKTSVKHSVIVNSSSDRRHLGNPLKEFNILGTRDYAYYYYNSLNCDIVALGMWDRALSEEEIFKVFTQIEGEFVKELNASDVILKEDSVLVGRCVGALADNIDLTKKNLKTPKIPEYPTCLDTLKMIAIVPDGIKKYFNIEDIVTKEDVPVLSKMYLYEKYTGHLLATTWSHPTTGKFFFKNLESGFEYIITSWDKDLEYRSIIKDYG